MDDAAIVALFWARDERAIPAAAEKIRCLLRRHRRKHPARPAGRGGMRQRHLSPGVERHAAPQTCDACGIFWAGSPGTWP